MRGAGGQRGPKGRMTPVTRAAWQALKSEPAGAKEYDREGIWVRYPDRRRSPAGHGAARLHVARATLLALERRGLAYRTWHGKRVTRWRVK